MGNRQADAKPKSPAEKSASSASQVEHKERAPVMYFSPATHPQKELLFTALHVRAVQHVERLVEPENHDKLEVCCCGVSPVLAAAWSPATVCRC